MKRRYVGHMLGMMLALAGPGAGIQAQEQGSDASPGGALVVPGCCGDEDVPILPATRVADADISVDGLMGEAAWGAAAVATRFTQFQPDEGQSREPANRGSRPLRRRSPVRVHAGT